MASGMAGARCRGAAEGTGPGTGTAVGVGVCGLGAAAWLSPALRRFAAVLMALAGPLLFRLG